MLPPSSSLILYCILTEELNQRKKKITTPLQAFFFGQGRKRKERGQQMINLLFLDGSSIHLSMSHMSKYSRSPVTSSWPALQNVSLAEVSRCTYSSYLSGLSQIYDLHLIFGDK